jgi:hypothetical protein
VGVAAGLDKHAEAIDPLMGLGALLKKYHPSYSRVIIDKSVSLNQDLDLLRLDRLRRDRRRVIRNPAFFG